MSRTETPGLTDADQIRALLDRNGTVSPDECATFRRRVRAGETPLAIAKDVTWSYKAVTEHIAGRCRHDGGPVPAALDPAGGGLRVSARECATIRRLDADGYPTGTIVVRVGRSPGTVRRHARGECRHVRDRESGPS